MPERFDDAPRWYWAVSNRPWSPPESNAGDKVVVACGQRELWARVRREIDTDERCAWMSFGSPDGVVTMSDCFGVFFILRECYGANLNRSLLELAQVPTFARYIREAPTALCNLVSNPLSTAPLLREPYDHSVEERLGCVVERTLGITDDTWRRS